MIQTSGKGVVPGFLSPVARDKLIHGSIERTAVSGYYQWHIITTLLLRLILLKLPR